MPRSLTVSQINALGERLRRAVRPSSEDLILLQQLRSDYDVPLAAVEERLRRSGLSPTSRLKTVGTMIDKLKRERTRLSKMQDIAGVRIVLDLDKGWREQDRVVDIVRSLFPASVTIDRRRRPSQGYRAVHVVVTTHECKVEIQIRTFGQDVWAQVMEHVADTLGRQVRYGGEPDHPDAPFGTRTRRDFVRGILKYSDLIADVDEAIAAGAHDRAYKLMADLRSLGEELTP